MKLQRSDSLVLGKQLVTHNSINCGVDNPISLHMRFYWLESGEVSSVFTPGIFHEGHMGMMHGGMISSVLDETMGRCNAKFNAESVPYVTGELTVRFEKPILTGNTYKSVAHIESEDGRKRYIVGHIIDSENNIYASAEGVWFRVDFVDDTKRTEGIKDNTEELDKADPKYL